MIARRVAQLVFSAAMLAGAVSAGGGKGGD
jgi:hypothetical protein